MQQRADKRRRKKEIFEAARQVFLEKGFRHATIRDITAAAAVSPGTFYLYFQSKGEIYALLMLTFLEHIKKEIQGVTGHGTPKEKLINLRKLFFRLYDSDKRILVNLIHSRYPLAGVSPDVIDRIQTLSGQCLDVLKSTIQGGMAQGILKKENPVVVADIIWGIFSALILLSENDRMVNNRKEFVKNTLETALETVHRGMSPGKRRPGK